MAIAFSKTRAAAHYSAGRKRKRGNQDYDARRFLGDRELDKKKLWRRSRRRGEKRNVRSRSSRTGEKNYEEVTFHREKRSGKDEAVHSEARRIVAAGYGARRGAGRLMPVIAVHCCRVRLQFPLMIRVDRALISAAAGSGNYQKRGASDGSVDQKQSDQTDRGSDTLRG